MYSTKQVLLCVTFNLSISESLPMLSFAGLDVWLPATLLIMQQYLPSFDLCTLGMMSVELFTPENFSTSHDCHSPLSFVVCSCQ